MLIRRPEDVAQQEMTMPGASGVRMRLMVGREDGAPNFAMRQFEVEPAGHTPLHQHNYEHEVLVVAGQGELVVSEDGQETREIRDGDTIFVPANRIHQFRNTGSQPLKFVCLVPTQFDCGGGQCQPTPGS